MIELIARLEGLSAKATKGPWRVDLPPSVASPRFMHISGPRMSDYALAKLVANKPESESNAALIVELVNNLPEILNALRARKGHIEAQGGSDGLA